MGYSTQETKAEVSIRDLILIILKGKLLIAILTIASVVISGVLSFFILPPRYEAKAELLANPFNFNQTNLADSINNDIIEQLTKLPSMTIETYLQQILTPDVLNSTIKELDLRDPDGKLISAGRLRERISVKNIDGTNTLEITANGEDPELTANVANALAQSFIQFISMTSRTQGQQVVDLIAEKLVAEQRNLNEKSKALAEYWRNNRNINLLKKEAENFINQISSYQTDLQNAETQILADTETLRVLAEAAKNLPGIDLNDFQINILVGSTANKQGNADDQLQLSLGKDGISVALLKIEISKIQNRLAANTSLKSILENQITEMDKKLTETQILVTEEEYKFNTISRDMAMAVQAYDAYQLKYKDALLTVATDIGKTSIIVTSAAVAPEAPVSPNKMFNLIIAALFGILLGIFVVLFTDYWQKAKLHERDASC